MSNNLARLLGRVALRILPRYNRTLLQFCQRYVDEYHGDNDSNPETNGERRFVSAELARRRDVVVFDVGANSGEWARSVIEINSTARLHCFEPSATTYRRLSAWPHWPPQVQLNHVALGDTEGTCELNIVNHGSGMNSLYVRHGVEGGAPVTKENVTITTVDQYCRRTGVDRIDFLKVDVEGHELAVFTGASGMLNERRINVIQFEYGGCNLDARVYLIDIWQFLEPFGFEFYKLHASGPQRIQRYCQNLETFKYANYIARLPRSA